MLLHDLIHLILLRNQERRFLNEYLCHFSLQPLEVPPVIARAHQTLNQNQAGRTSW